MKGLDFNGSNLSYIVSGDPDWPYYGGYFIAIGSYSLVDGCELRDAEFATLLLTQGHDNTITNNYFHDATQNIQNGRHATYAIYDGNPNTEIAYNTFDHIGGFPDVVFRDHGFQRNGSWYSPKPLTITEKTAPVMAQELLTGLWERKHRNDDCRIVRYLAAPYLFNNSDSGLIAHRRKICSCLMWLFMQGYIDISKTPDYRAVFFTHKSIRAIPIIDSQSMPLETYKILKQCAQYNSLIDDFHVQLNDHWHPHRYNSKLQVPKKDIYEITKGTHSILVTDFLMDVMIHKKRPHASYKIIYSKDSDDEFVFINTN